jgi:hypothetical protein
MKNTSKGIRPQFVYLIKNGIDFPSRENISDQDHVRK